MSTDSDASRSADPSALVAGGVAHDLNNMLSALSGTLQIVRDALPSGTLVFELAAAERLIDRGAELAHTLFSLERGDQGEREPVSLQKAVDDVLAIIENRLQKRGIEVHRAFAPVPDVTASRCGLLRVVLDMLSSAAHGGGRIDLAIGPEGDDAVWLSVCDTAEAADSGPPGDRVAAWGGRLTVDVHPGGTTRRLVLPVHRGAADADGEAAPLRHVAVDGERFGAGLTVLVVDDEKPIRKMLTVLLEGRGFEVRTAADVPSALERLARAPYDVVLLDLVMPGVQGTELLDRLHREQPDLPVIVISGESVDPSIEALKRAGAAEVMRKPLKLERLAVMCRAVARREPLPD